MGWTCNKFQQQIYNFLSNYMFHPYVDCVNQTLSIQLSVQNKFVNFEAKLKQSPSCQNLSSVVNLIKHFTIVIYDSTVIWLENCPYKDYRDVIYARKMFIRLATEAVIENSFSSVKLP